MRGRGVVGSGGGIAGNIFLVSATQLAPEKFMIDKRHYVTIIHEF